MFYPSKSVVDYHANPVTDPSGCCPRRTHYWAAHGLHPFRGQQEARVPWKVSPWKNSCLGRKGWIQAIRSCRHRTLQWVVIFFLCLIDGEMDSRDFLQIRSHFFSPDFVSKISSLTHRFPCSRRSSTQLWSSWTWRQGGCSRWPVDSSRRIRSWRLHIHHLWTRQR